MGKKEKEKGKNKIRKENVIFACLHELIKLSPCLLVWFFIVSFTHKVENLKYNISNKINDPKSFLWQQIALLLLWEKRVCNVGEKRENKKKIKKLTPCLL